MRGVTDGQEVLLAETGEGTENEYVKVKIWLDLHHLCSHSCITPPCSCHSCPLCLSRCSDQKKKKILCNLQRHLSPDAAFNQMNSVFLCTLSILAVALSRYLQHFNLLYWSIALLFISPIRL